MEQHGIHATIEHANIANAAFYQLILGRLGRGVGVVTVVKKPAQITPELRLESTETVIVNIADDIGLVRCNYGASVSSRPDLPKIGQDTRTHKMNQVRFECFHSLKFPAVKSPVRKNDGHFRIEGKGYGPKLHDIFLSGGSPVIWDRLKNLVPTHAKIADKLALGSHDPVHLGRKGF
jgi:hypothetical protein